MRHRANDRLPENSKPTKISQYCLLAIFTKLSLDVTPVLRRLLGVGGLARKLQCFEKVEIRVFGPETGSLAVSFGT